MAATLTKGSTTGEGETPTLTLTAEYLNTSGAWAARNISSASAIKTRFKKDDGTTLEITSYTITDGTNGVYTVPLTQAQLNTLPSGSGQTFVSIITIAGIEYWHWFDGELNIRSGSLP